MINQPNYDSQAMTNLTERTTYEVWLLEAAYATAEQELFPPRYDSIVYPLGQSSYGEHHYSSFQLNLSDWRPKFMDKGAPLIFVSTFKLIDMLMEWVLSENGHTPSHRFVAKLNQLTQPIRFPDVIENRTWLKERLVGLFKTLTPLRNIIIHRKEFTSTNGEVTFSNQSANSAMSKTISSAHLKTLVTTVICVLKYVDGSWALDELKEKTLRYNLDIIKDMHGLPSLIQDPPQYIGIRVYVPDVDPISIDQAGIQKAMPNLGKGKDAIFALRIVVVLDSEPVEAYQIPWRDIEDGRVVWSRKELRAQYPSDIPSDV